MKFEALEKFCDLEKIEYKLLEPMKFHTSFKIGGQADIFISVKTKEELITIINKSKEFGVPYYVIGKGSNLLVSDNGIEGAVISLLGMNNITVSDNLITANAGASLAAVCCSALENSLSGLEFAYGIPGAVGGALYMNAGAYGGEMSQIVQSAEYIDFQGELKQIDLNDMALGYRTSVFKNNLGVIVSVTFKLEKGEKSKIKALMNDYMSRRKSKQPLEYASAGSTFKRPKGNFAGALIEKNNLKGYSIGGARVSEKHAGFVINFDNATCKDVKELMKHIKNTVLENDGVELEPEVIFVGRE